ncbi:MAG: TRM11 family methyltransferase [Candidatus Bathyarchaeota archaeon]
MEKLFFLVSCEHPTLPISELRAILETEDAKYKILERFTQVLRIESNPICVEAIRFRSALTRVCCKEIFNCKANLQEILGYINSQVIEQYIGNESFVVRIRRVKGATPELDRVNLEGELGEQILRSNKNSKVDLSKPQKKFFGIITDNRFLFGLVIAEIIPKPFSERRPRRRPFFHPTAMPAKMCRTMVNLSQPKNGDLLLDPFCGTGGMLVEAGLIGCRVIGFDAKPHMLRGGLKNLMHFGINLEGLIIADARFSPVKEVNCIATDPPYGRSASTLGSVTRLIVEDFLYSVADTIPRGRKICMASPKTIHVSETAEDAGFKHLESHFVYVHKSLTREIVVFERE